MHVLYKVFHKYFILFISCDFFQLIETSQSKLKLFWIIEKLQCVGHFQTVGSLSNPWHYLNQKVFIFQINLGFHYCTSNFILKTMTKVLIWSYVALVKVMRIIVNEIFKRAEVILDDKNTPVRAMSSWKLFIVDIKFQINRQSRTIFQRYLYIYLKNLLEYYNNMKFWSIWPKQQSLRLVSLKANLPWMFFWHERASEQRNSLLFLAAKSKESLVLIWFT